MTIEAAQFPPKSAGGAAQAAFLDWLKEREGDHPCRFKNGSLIIQTLEGDLFANPGDWIIQGVAGELYPCSEEIFEQTYDAAGEGPVDTEPAPVQAEVLTEPAPAEPYSDQILAAAYAIGGTVYHALRNAIVVDEEMPKVHRLASDFVRANPNAPAEAIVIHLKRRGQKLLDWCDMNAATQAEWEFFKLSLVLLDAKLAAMQPVEEARAVLGYAEPAEILADQPGDLTDQAVR